MKKFALLLLSFCSAQFLFGQNAPGIEWEKSLGGSDYDEAYSIQQISNGDFIVAGRSQSTDGDVSGNHGTDDYWIVKLDTDGNVLWQKSFGGGGLETAYSIKETVDGGMVVAGWSQSADGDVTSSHGGDDYWIVKLDSGGNIEWQKTLGGSSYDEASSIQQTIDGGFIIVGSSESTDGDVTGNHGNYDYWVVKLDTAGSLVWQKSFGGSDYDIASSVQQIANGGFIVAGKSHSNDGDVSGNHGAEDYWVVKLDDGGNLVWQKSLGGSNDDEAVSVQQTSDGGFIVAGWAYSNNGNVTGNHGSDDYWIVKLDANGNIEWQKCFGGTEIEKASSIQQTFDNGFIIAGFSESNDGEVSGNHGNFDYWVVKLDVGGSLVWQKSLGGSDIDEAYSIQQTMDGGFAVAGWSGSNDGDITGHHGISGFRDYWIVKLAATTNIISADILTYNFKIFPNPTTGNFQLTFPTPLLQPTTLSITNLLGQKLFEEDLPRSLSGNSVNTLQQSFDFSQWQKGMYFITIRDENSFGERQLVIQ